MEKQPMLFDGESVIFVRIFDITVYATIAVFVIWTFMNIISGGSIYINLNEIIFGGGYFYKIRIYDSIYDLYGEDIAYLFSNFVYYSRIITFILTISLSAWILVCVLIFGTSKELLMSGAYKWGCLAALSIVVIMNYFIGVPVYVQDSDSAYSIISVSAFGIVLLSLMYAVQPLLAIIVSYILGKKLKS